VAVRPPTHRPDEHATRARLLGAALSLFAQKGFAATSTRELAAAADCNISMIAHYFGSKEGLLRELIREQMAGPGDELRAMQGSDESFEQKVERFVDYMVTKLDRDHDFMRVVHREVVNGAKPEMLDEFGHIIGASLSLFTALVEEARQAGRVRAEIDPRLACLQLMGMIQFYFVNLPLTSRLIGPPTAEMLGRLRRQAVETFLGGVLYVPSPNTNRRPDSSKASD
jgi:TetR/AcrR family transcriptional regulator